MRELTFKGFLKEYVKALSKNGTSSLYKLAAEAAGENFRLREPLLLYALYSGKGDLLLRAAKNTAVYTEYSNLLSRYSEDDFTRMFSENSPKLSLEYRKVWQSYCVQKNRHRSDNETKALMRKKVLRMQQQYGISNYRIYEDLKLNPGNINAWLKYGKSNKVSLEIARKTLLYLENTAK